MFYFKADRIHDGYQWLEPGTVIAATGDGTIEALYPAGALPSGVAVRHFGGILCPGFVNTHCHLELSHMKGAIAEGKRLVPFLQAVMTGRNGFSDEDKAIAIQQAIASSRQNGIVAVGDIANGTDTLPYRETSGLHIHTFVESIGFTETKVEERFAWPLGVYGQFAAQHGDTTLLRQSIVPHAPYSVSESLFRLINAHEPGTLLSVHNEETAAENELYRFKEGELFDLYRTLNIDAAFFRPSGKSSLQTYLPQLPDRNPVILVHNTFMEAEDLAFLEASGREIHLCLCPNANWYIERKMPPALLFQESGIPVCLGTDSLASNHELSIWAEIGTLQQHFPELSLETLLRWGTSNGAKALQMDQEIGSLTPGKKPGIVHINSENKISRIG
ncbi:amidohydrolase family protein [Taibaiella koreensis]|uniref:amidohydrolase family protein n=1 Tax=Taibaiella koreensis TaxID=1268548 RepID=UPI000E59B42F|nr:amidohydrolase family protein [Taibaiella koreensis]